MMKIQIIILNVLVIGICFAVFYYIYDRYYDENILAFDSIKSNEDLVVLVIFLGLFLMAIVAVCTQFFLTILSKKNLAGLILKSINTIYGIILLIIGALAFYLFIRVITSETIMAVDDGMMVSGVFFFFLLLSYLGLLILRQVIKIGNNTTETELDEILDSDFIKK